MRQTTIFDFFDYLEQVERELNETNETELDLTPDDDASDVNEETLNSDVNDWNEDDIVLSPLEAVYFKALTEGNLEIALQAALAMEAKNAKSD
jgi:hypothetical protein